MIAVRDVAAFTVACLDHPAAERETIPLGGPGAVSWRDVVRTFEEALGREVDVRTVPPGDPVPGLPDVMVQLVTGIETYDSVLDMDVIRATFDVRQTSLREFVDGFVGGAP
jgi:NADH dehydrogenase